MPLSERPILVTGGAGLIGSTLVSALNRRGRTDILIADILGHDGKWRHLLPLRFADYFESESLLESLSSPRLADIGTVFHLGACTSTICTDASRLMRNNYEFTRCLAEWAVAGGRRFVYASSAATYGDGSAGMEDGDAGLHAFRPLNMYAYSKHLFDLYAKAQGWLDRIIGLKYFNVFGPGEEHKGDMCSMVFKAFHQIRDTGTVKLFRSGRPDFKDGEQRRDFLYVKDAVEATLHLAETPQAAGLYNAGSGVASTWIELVTAVFAAMARPVAIEFTALPEALRAGYQYWTCADVARLKNTGWTGPRFSLGAAVHDYVRNHLLPSSP
jgi:ADP-L-glycero-D-manno-heptose 6-epimerase